MSADLLRRAAEKLRGVAGAVPPPRDGEEPWYRTGGKQFGFWRVLIEVEPEEAEYIALMHQPVALALAVAMDEVAKAVRFGGGIGARLGYAELIACARAVLREPEGGAS